MIVCCLFLGACTQLNEKKPSSDEPSQAVQKTILPPISSSIYSFVEIVGFLPNDTILVNRQNKNMYELIRRELISGEEEIIFQTVNPILLCDISPDGSKIIIQGSHDEMHSRIQVVNLEGEILWEDLFEATEIQWYFNPFQTSELYIQSFQSDWSYETQCLNVETKEIQVVDFNQTFFQWESEDEIVYLDWDDEYPASTAQLVRHNMKTGEVEVVKENCFAFTIAGDVWNIFQVIEDGNQSKMKIQSIELENNKEIFSYETSLQESFSENLQVFNFAYIPYAKGLLFYEQVNGEPNLLFGKADGLIDMKQPFKGAPPIHPQMDGKYILIGYQNEWLLQVDTMTWQSMYT